MKGAAAIDFVERLARTLAKVDENDFEKDPERYWLLARAAMIEPGSLGLTGSCHGRPVKPVNLF